VLWRAERTFTIRMKAPCCCAQRHGRRGVRWIPVEAWTSRGKRHQITTTAVGGGTTFIPVADVGPPAIPCIDGSQTTSRRAVGPCGSYLIAAPAGAPPPTEATCFQRRITGRVANKSKRKGISLTTVMSHTPVIKVLRFPHA